MNEINLLRRRRNTVLGIISVICMSFFIWTVTTDGFHSILEEVDPIITTEYTPETESTDNKIGIENESATPAPLALDELAKLEIKGRAPKTGYSRAEFLQNGAWGKWKDCDTRQRILGRDLTDIRYGDNGCVVLSGQLNPDPYTGKVIDFTRGTSTSSAVQIDHVVALSDAWQTGAQLLDFTTRNKMANDDLNLLAVDGPANQQKSDGDAATWLPPNKAFRCQYVARQIAVKIKYGLWVTQPEHDAMTKVLETCPNERTLI